MGLGCLLLHQVISLAFEFAFAISFPITPFTLVPFPVPLAFPFPLPLPLPAILYSIMHSHPTILGTLLPTRMVAPGYSPISHPSTLLSSGTRHAWTTSPNMHRRNRSTYTQRRTRRWATEVLMSMSRANSNKCHLRFDGELTLSVVMQRGRRRCLRMRRMEMRAS